MFHPSSVERIRQRKGPCLRTATVVPEFQGTPGLEDNRGYLDEHRMRCQVCKGLVVLVSRVCRTTASWCQRHQPWPGRGNGFLVVAVSYHQSVAKHYLCLHVLSPGQCLGPLGRLYGHVAIVFRLQRLDIDIHCGLCDIADTL